MAKSNANVSSVVKITTPLMKGVLTRTLLGGIIFLSFGILTYFSSSLFLTSSEDSKAYTSGIDSEGQTYWDFAYSGASESWIAPENGIYRVELWGAEGGGNPWLTSCAPDTTFKGSCSAGGGYTSGEIELFANEDLHIHVGQGAAGRSGGWNGGGTGGAHNSSSYGFGGGGATDIRLISGNIYSRIMVAGGGGGSENASISGYNPNDQDDGSGGPGGGLSGINGKESTGVNTPGIISLNTILPGANPKKCFINTSVGGNQIGGNQFGIGSDGGLFGSSSGGCYYDVGAGGGGYWGGMSGTDSAGGGGGSSYISGLLGAVAVSADGSTVARNNSSGVLCDMTNALSDAICSVHYSGKVFTNGVTISGNQEMPNSSGIGVSYGNFGHGYARITLLTPLESNLMSASSPSMSINIPSPLSFGTLTPTSTSAPAYLSSELTISTDAPDGYTASLSYDNCLKHALESNTATCTMVQESKKLPLSVSLDHCTTQHVIGMGDVTMCDSNPTTFNTIQAETAYDISKLAGIYTNSITLTATANLPLPPSITDITTNADNTVLTITGTNFSTTYNILVDSATSNSCKIGIINSDTELVCYLEEALSADADITVRTWGGEDEFSISVINEWIFEYNGTTPLNGTAQLFEVPKNGRYKIELWGASGNDNPSYNREGKGGYTSGEIQFSKGQTYYIYTGSRMPNGSSAIGTSTTWVFNSCAPASTSPPASTFASGATDIRLINEDCSNSGLRSRIMVAGAGGGGDHQYGIGGAGGGLSGSDGRFDQLGARRTLGYGGTQTAGGVGQLNEYASYCGYNNPSGFGIGATSRGASGYWGGGGGCEGGGGGGSSFISGHTGAVAIASASSTSPRTGTSGATCASGTTDNLCSVHYSGLKFSNTNMIDGAGYKWTNTKGILTPMPNPTAEGNYASGVGHSGNGYAKITYVGP